MNLPFPLDKSDAALSALAMSTAREYAAGDNVSSLRELEAISYGMATWRRALLLGRMPTSQEFEHSNAKETSYCWPREPLFTEIVKALADLQLPRFVLRHPETAGAVMMGILNLAMEFNIRTRDFNEGGEEEEGIGIDKEGSESDTADNANIPFSEQELNAVAEELAKELIDQWGRLITGVQALDHLFGADHSLLDASLQNDESSVSRGFGLNDGVWQHNGWQTLPLLQKRLSTMPELKKMLASLGRRPSTQGHEFARFLEQQHSADSPLGVELDPFTRDSVRGITKTASLSEMLPSEAVLLKGSHALRRLFLAKEVEAKLLGYDTSGYSDVPSRPKARSRYMSRLPSAPGGPIIICLDTSWSMTGDRETIAKAVVLESVKAAHKQNRDCTVVAFSSNSNTVESNLLSVDKHSIRRLLDFLSCSFEGGTDVTGALRHAVEVLGTKTMAASDILLVSDGELPNPPVSESLMQELSNLKSRTGMEIHGLLVGKKESEPLDLLCTSVHDFLLKYDFHTNLIQRAREKQ